MDEVIVKSEAMKKIFHRASIFANSGEPILILGESGTGKEIIARYIHKVSSRKDRQFVAVNCANFPENLVESELFGYKKGSFTDAKGDKIGLIQIADKGTLFLDEIGDISLHLQSKFLRVIENREVLPVGATKTEKVDFKLICATNKDIFKMTEENAFREDLLHRISTLVLEIPPLRERIEEIPVFIEKFLNEVKSGLYLSPEAMEIILCFPWPGNIRQLRNALIYAANVAEDNCIKLEDLPVWLQKFTRASDKSMEKTLKERMKEYEKQIFEYYKKIYGDDTKELAKRLGISLTSVYRKFYN